METFLLCVNHCLAKALYENSSESPDELSFCKGDIVTVLEQNPGGLEGWWLCSLRGRQGIAPGNRLRLMPGMYDCTGLGYAASHNVPGNGNSGNFSASLPSTPSLTNGSRRQSWHTNSNRNSANCNEAEELEGLSSWKKALLSGKL
ncbi:docking protein-like protein [Leptotrombidium deliense]|uniref:Docking protein-like protein n=1 Tax=Leptotrombidium deliense TaxID=299467 RepID=A0A443SQX5_9ACAR|nr:docking protein-like protein [Leptotrombidium deliense]